MNNLLKWGQKILIGLAIAFISVYLYSLFLPKPIEPSTHEEAEVRVPLRDTLEKFKYRIDTLLKPYKVEIPKEIIVYQDKYLPGEVRYLAKKDSLNYQYIIDSLTGKIVEMGKLASYLNATKYNLVSGNFKKNSITLDLMNPNGEVKTKVYSVDYNNLQYYYDGEGLRSEKLRHTLLPTAKLESPKALFTTGYVSAHYNPFNKTTRAEVDYYIFYNRVGIINRVSIDIKANPQPAYRIGLTYRFK